MTSQTADEPITNATDDAATASASQQASVYDNVVLEETIITSAGEMDEMTVAQITRARAVARVPAGRRPTLVQLVLGSILVLTDEVGERIVVEESEIPSTVRTPESVFRPMSEFEQLLGGEQYRRTRYLTIGMASEARKAAGRSFELVDDVTDTAGRTFWRFAGPVWSSTLLSPVRKPVQHWRTRGEDRVQQWINTGMQQEIRSRSVASASLNNLVQESVGDLTNNPDVQVLVQEVIESQSISMVAEILEEIRERFISIDIWVQGIFGKAVPEPVPFRDSFLRSLAKSRPQYEHLPLRTTMAGYPTGFVTRLAAFFIDVLLLLVFYAIASASLSGTLNLFGLTDLVSTFLSSGSLMSEIVLGLLALSSFLVVTSYGVLGWTLAGKTIGDAIMGFQVVDLAGGRMSFWRAVRRMIGVYVSAIPFFLGFIWVLFDKQRRGWMDKIGGTYVVYDWPAQPEEVFLNDRVVKEMAKDGLEVSAR